MYIVAAMFVVFYFYLMYRLVKVSRKIGEAVGEDFNGF